MEPEQNKRMTDKNDDGQDLVEEIKATDTL